jgi:hypothetical protein
MPDGILWSTVNGSHASISTAMVSGTWILHAEPLNLKEELDVNIINSKWKENRISGKTIDIHLMFRFLHASVQYI